MPFAPVVEQFAAERYSLGTVRVLLPRYADRRQNVHVKPSPEADDVPGLSPTRYVEASNKRVFGKSSDHSFTGGIHTRTVNVLEFARARRHPKHAHSKVIGFFSIVFRPLRHEVFVGEPGGSGVYT